MHNQNDQVKEDQMRRACNTNGEKRNDIVIGGKARRKEITMKTKIQVGG
jgi:hypothetical protein